MSIAKPQVVNEVLESFDVMIEQSIGTVSITDDPSAERAHIVAFRLIAEYDSEGVYTFPMPDGRTNRITVEFVDNRKK